jgi:DNA helicase HerA-like ATPase
MRVCYYFGHIQVVVEEVQLYSSPHTLSKWLKNCLLTGRHKGLSLLFTTQRPGELNKTILSQCSHIFCGQIVEGNDLRYVSSFLNEDSKRLSGLPPRRFLYFSDDGIKEISNEF